MSFFETLKAMGLFPNQQAPSQGGGSYTAGNPYGLDPAMLSQARWASLGNISSQLLALGQQMTPQDRAKMMGNMDFTGGLQQNLMNAAQMKLAQRKMQQDDLAIQQATDARAALAEKIKALPQGRLRDAAMFYLTAGDVDKAAEVIYKAEKRINPNTGEFELVNSFDLSPIGGAAVAPGGVPMPAAADGAPAPAAPPAPSAGGVPAMPAAPAGGGSPSQPPNTSRPWVTRLTGDPNLTDAEVRQIAMEVVSKNDPAAGLTLYREIKKQQQQAEQQKASQDQTNLQGNRTAADALTDDFTAKTKSYDTIIGAGQRAVQVATTPNMSAAAKLTTLYQFMKALDPDGAVREGDVQMAQAMQSIKDQWLQYAEAQLRGGGPISETMVKDMAREMARLANDARGRKELKRIEMVGLSRGRQIPDKMVDPTLDSKDQNMTAPIGLDLMRQTPSQQVLPRIPLAAARELQSDPSPEAIAEFDATFGPGAAARVLQGQRGGR